MVCDEAEDSAKGPVVFPQYRCTADGRHAYRIMADRFTELQRVGRRFQVYEVVARAYPEMLRIQEMLHGADGHFRPMDAAAWDQWWREASAPHGQ